MTAAELIAILEQCPPDAVVHAEDEVVWVPETAREAVDYHGRPIVILE